MAALGYLHGIFILLVLVRASDALSVAPTYDQAVAETVAINPCSIGPSYWCLSEDNMKKCMVEDKVVGVCGQARRLTLIPFGPGYVSRTHTTTSRCVCLQIQQQELSQKNYSGLLRDR
jgi:Saposin A-type domain